MNFLRWVVTTFGFSVGLINALSPTTGALDAVSPAVAIAGSVALGLELLWSQLPAR